MTDKARTITEAERAEDHYDRRDEDDRWGEPIDVHSPEQLSVMVSARFSRAEADRLSTAAETAGMTRSAFVRQAALSLVTGKVVDVDRVRRNVDEAERQLASARHALG